MKLIQLIAAYNAHIMAALTKLEQAAEHEAYIVKEAIKNMEESIKYYFTHHLKDVLFFTSDGQCFYTRHEAANHAQNLPVKEVTEVRRADVLASQAEIASRVDPEETEPVKTEETELVKTEETEPVKTEEVPPVKTEETEPVKTEDTDPKKPKK